ncbi:MAG: histidine phosphatase family protein [Acidobacteria bacterium]|nr:MAG: histidine phosphatase family protein [Acidobacteriota bacterium]
MKTLLVLRHAKSDWHADSGGDHDRPLNPRGRRAARAVGRFLSAAGVAPQQVVSSSAVRARHTAELAAEAGAWHARLEITRKLYDASPGTVIDAVQHADDDVEVLLVAGHEPTSSALVSTLIGGGRLRLPTAAAACVELSVSHWRELAPGRGHLRWLITPKLLRRIGWDG